MQLPQFKNRQHSSPGTYPDATHADGRPSGHQISARGFGEQDRDHGGGEAGLDRPEEHFASSEERECGVQE